MNQEGDGSNQGQPRTSRYHSPLRARQAEETRRRIATAARELFATHGFAATTVARIAERAEVSAQTVYATFGSKGAIVHALLTQFEDDADAAGWRARIAAEPTPHGRLLAFAHWTCALFASSKAVITAAHAAAGDPALAELHALGDQHRRQALRPLVSDLARANELRTDLTEASALDRAWMLTGVELYLAATNGCGWSDDHYTTWLTELLTEQLLNHPHPTP